MAESQEAVALELTKWIMGSAYTDHNPSSELILKVYAECLGVVNGASLEIVRLRLKNEKEAVEKEI